MAAINHTFSVKISIFILLIFYVGKPACGDIVSSLPFKKTRRFDFVIWKDVVRKSDCAIYMVNGEGRDTAL